MVRTLCSDIVQDAAAQETPQGRHLHIMPGTLPCSGLHGYSVRPMLWQCWQLAGWQTYMQPCRWAALQAILLAGTLLADRLAIYMQTTWEAMLHLQAHDQAKLLPGNSAH